MSISRVVMSRRTTISLALAGPVAMGACDLDPPVRDVADAPSPTPAPDTEVVAMARKSIVVMVASLEAAATAYPRLSPAFSPWLALHTTHLEVLDDGTAVSEVDGPTVVGRAAAASKRLMAEEATLATRLAGAAGQSASGDLARVLASMSAAIRQRLVP